MKGRAGKDDQNSSAKQLIRKKELENSALKKILDFLEKESGESKPKRRSKRENKSIQ